MFITAKNNWIKFRHKIIRDLAYAVLVPYSKIKYGIKVEKFKDNPERQYLVVFNHQTAFDQFFVGMSFKKAVYFLASEDIFSNGWISALIRFLVAPIPIKKQTTDIGAVKNCLRVAKEGGTIALAPEGNRTYSGKTEYMNASIASLAKMLKLPLAIYRIEGGYGVHPRWSDVVRKGKMRSYVSKVIEPHEYKDMTNDELFEIINNELYVDEANADNVFLHKKRAEYLERAMYVCPYCGLANFESHNDTIKCKTCNREIKYDITTELKGVGFDFPYRFVSEWYDYQKDYINSLDVTANTKKPLFSDNARLSKVIVYKKKVLLDKNSSVSLFGDKIVIGKDLVFPFNEVSAVTVLGKNKLNIYHDKNIYQLKGSKRFNALKYVNIYNRYMNIIRGDENGKFLGL